MNKASYIDPGSRAPGDGTLEFQSRLDPGVTGTLKLSGAPPMETAVLEASYAELLRYGASGPIDLGRTRTSAKLSTPAPGKTYAIAVQAQTRTRRDLIVLAIIKTAQPRR